MVYIEDRISELENAVKALQNELSDALEDIRSNSAKKQKLDDQGQLETLKEELQQTISQKIGYDELNNAIVGLRTTISHNVEKEAFDKALTELKGSLTQKVATEQMQKSIAELQKQMFQKIHQTGLDVQAVTEKRLATFLSKPDFQKTIATINSTNSQAHAQNLKKDQIPLITNQIETSVLAMVDSKMQSTLDLCQGMLTTNSELFKRMQNPSSAASAQWTDVDLHDINLFDSSKVYRIRIGDPPVSRWLYSSEVSQMQIFIADNYNHNVIVVNSASKASYGSRGFGAPLECTTYYAMFQLQSRPC